MNFFDYFAPWIYDLHLDTEGTLSPAYNLPSGHTWYCSQQFKNFLQIKKRFPHGVLSYTIIM